MPTLTTSPWQATLDRISGKTVVGSKLRSAEWAQVPVALRERAFFSAGVEHARTLSAMREKVTEGLSQARPGGIGMNSARFVADMRSMLGAAPGDSGSLSDLTSVRRLKLIWDFQTADAHGQAAHVANMDPDIQDAFPAQRLTRVESRRVPRDWYARWAIAGSSVGWVGASRRDMVALVTSPIWTALSEFGRPWPPFDYNSGMGLEAVDRAEAESLGLLPAGEPPAQRLQRLREALAAAQKNWNEGLQASVKGLTDQARAWLKSAFGDQISVTAERAAWKPDATPVVETPAPATTATPLPDVDRVTAAAAKAATREEAHAIVALPANERGALSLNPSPKVTAQTEQASSFISTVLHKDVATTSTAKVILAPKDSRGKYDPRTAVAHVRPGAVDNTVHELAHHIECTDPEILAECRAFLQRRAKPGEKPQWLGALTGNSRYKRYEVALEDEWVAKGGSVYCGKVYQSGAYTEILTMGLQRLYLDPIGFARQDPEYFQFILKLLRP